MKTATKNLENDHEHILRLIEVMEVVIRQDHADLADCDTIISLIRNFADSFHHAKEENLLFPLLATKGFSPEQGPVAVMLNDHATGRNFVKGMREALEGLRDNENGAQKRLFENMSGYINLLRAHISKENNILFRMADNVLSGDEQAGLLEKFTKVEATDFAGGKIEKFINEIDVLEEKYKQQTP